MSNWDDKICIACSARFYGYSISLYCDECQHAKTKNSVSVIENKNLDDALAVAEKKKQLENLHFDSVMNTLKGKNRLVVLYWIIGWLSIGVGVAFYNRGETKNTGCIYRSIGSFVNPGYIVGCELFRERFEIGKQSIEEIRSK